MGTLPSRLRLTSIVTLTLGVLVALAGVFAPAAGAQSTCGEHGCVDVVAVDGIIDEIEADFIIESVRSANAAGDVVAVVLQLDSPGVAVSDARLNEVASVIAGSNIPVSIWIGASGSDALGGAAELVQIAGSVGVSLRSSGAASQEPLRYELHAER